jgi:hypothetical protein
VALFDKVKSQAQDVAKRAQEAGKAGQAKLDEIQAKRALDALYRDFGAAVYAERTKSPDAVPGAVDRLADAITARITADANDAGDTPS